MIVFFDLPTETSQQRREYAKFRKHLLKSGFMMMQESVYCKLLLNGTMAQTVSRGLKEKKPSQGLVQCLTVTEKQFSKMDFIVGRYEGDIICSDERFIEL